MMPTSISLRRHRAMLLAWSERRVARHESRIVPFDLISEQRVGSRQFDTLIAAQAMTLGVPLATRNVRDFEDIDLVTVNPWED